MSLRSTWDTQSLVSKIWKKNKYQLLTGEDGFVRNTSKWQGFNFFSIFVYESTRLHVYGYMCSIWKHEMIDVGIILSDLLPYSLWQGLSIKPRLCPFSGLANQLALHSETRIISRLLIISAFPGTQKIQIPLLEHEQSGLQPLSFLHSHCV